ncbi:MAG: hypothetical protein Q9225_002834 [Loekoesia sp. 1 TL-2023]
MTVRKEENLQTPVKSNRTPRKASGRTLSPAVNGVKRHSKHESSIGLDGADSEDAETEGEESSGADKVHLAQDDSDEPVRSKRRKSAPQQRLSKRLKRPAKDRVDDEHDVSEERVASRPKRTRASGINYSLLLRNSDYEDKDQPVPVVAAEEPKRKSKIITLRTNPSKALSNSVLDPNPRKTRKTASVDENHQAEKSPAVHEAASAKRKSARVKKIVDGSPTNRGGQSENPPEVLNSPRKRKPRILSHLDVVEHNPTPVSAAEPVKLSRKRKRSDGAADTYPETAAATDLTQDKESEQSEKKKRRAKQKIKQDLGLLPNGQPRQRRRRRTRQEMLLDQQTPKTVTTRRRGKYQFPYLDGYNGPAPPNLATIHARQDESERQNSASNPISDHDIASSLDSLDEDSPSESPTHQAESNLNETNNNPSSRPGIEAPVSTNPPKQTPTATTADPSVPATVGTPPSVREILLFPEDLAKGIDNALKMHASYEADKKSQLAASEAALAQQSQRVAELQQELADVREGLTTRLNAEKQEHEREISTLNASKDDMQKKFEAMLVKKDEELRSKSRRMIEIDACTTILERRLEAAMDAGATSKSKQAEEPPFEPAAALPSFLQASTQTEPLLQIQPQPPAQQQNNIKPLLSSLRNAVIRLAGHLRTSTAAHISHKAVIDKLDNDLEEDEITMRGVRNVVKELVEGTRKVGGTLDGAREASDEVKGEVMGLMDGVEH